MSFSAAQLANWLNENESYARRMGQPTQRATNYTARSNIDTAQIFLHANGQRPKRAPIRQCSRRRQRRGEPHTEDGLGVCFFSFLTSCIHPTQAEFFLYFFCLTFSNVGARENVLLGGAASQLAQRKHESATVNSPCGNTNADAISQNEAKPSS